ncbi:MAG: AsmA family protein [Gammaproteobacteria bacterium]|nr:MAG: AsmA family protein [Gammaproteobacteria bacterium]
MNKNKLSAVMSWVRRALYLVAGLVLVAVLLVGGALLFLDDDHYRQLLTFGADQLLDASLEIDGDFSLALGKEVTLVAEAVRLTANDGSYSATIGEFRGSQRLGSYLLTGTFWVNSLVLSDVQLDIKQGEEPTIELHDLSLPPVVIQEAQLNNLQLFYTQREPEVTHEISLLELLMDDVNDSGPIRVTGAGLVNGQPLSIDGSLGALSDLVGAGQPYSLNLEVASGPLQMRMFGAIADPVRGEGMDVNLEFTDPSLSKTLQLFDKKTPEIGSLRAQAHLSGSYAAPRLDNLEIHLERGKEVRLNITGKVGNLMTAEGLALQVDGRSSDPAVLSWLVFEKEDEVKTFSIRGVVHEDNGRFFATGVDAEGSTRAGLEISLKGDTRIPTRQEPRPESVRQLALKVSAPSMTALNLPQLGGLPEFGHVKGSANYVPYLDGARFTNMRLAAGDRKQVHTTVAGTIGFIPYEFNKGLSGMDLDVALTAVNSQVLGDAVNYDLPDLGAVQANMHVTGTTDNLVIDRISVNTGAPDQPTIRARGTARTRLREHTSTLKITLDVAVADLFAALRDVTPDYLGRLEGRVEMSDVDGSWGLDSFDFASTQTRLYTVKFSGALEDVVKRDKAEIKLLIDIPDPEALGQAADINLGDIASYRTEGVMAFNKKQITYNGTGQVGRSQTTTSLSGTLEGERPSLKGSVVIPVLYLEDVGLEPGTEPAPSEMESNAPAKQRQRSPHAFSRENLNFDIFRQLDLDLNIKVDEIASEQVSADKLHGRILLDNGRLQVRPMQLVAEGGPTDLDLVIDTRATPSVSLKLTANDQKLGHWLAQVQDQVPVDGFASYHIVLDARGASPHELVASLNGHVALAFENARVPRRYIDMLSGDVFGWVLGKTDREDRYANLDCVLAKFDINDGIAKSSLIAADGPRLAIEGTMTLDLNAETIDAVFLPKQKRKLFSSIAPVRLTGDMRDPDVHAVPAKEAATSIGSLVLVPYVAIPVTILGKLWASVNDKDEHGGGCASLEATKAAEAEKLKQQEAGLPDDEED